MDRKLEQIINLPKFGIKQNFSTRNRKKKFEELVINESQLKSDQRFVQLR